MIQGIRSFYGFAPRSCLSLRDQGQLSGLIFYINCRWWSGYPGCNILLPISSLWFKFVTLKDRFAITIQWLQAGSWSSLPLSKSIPLGWTTIFLLKAYHHLPLTWPLLQTIFFQRALRSHDLRPFKPPTSSTRFYWGRCHSWCHNQ